jgi:protoheme IX farnesyltransferase
MANGRLDVLGASWRDYLEMCKPRVVLLMLLTTLVGMFIAVPGGTAPPTLLVLTALIGIALVAGSAAVINHVADAHIDRKMARTHARPVAQGRVSFTEAIVFSSVIGCLGMLILVTQVNVLTAWLNLLSWAGYGLLYTLYLKRRTSQNIVIGGLFGAAPPLFGWTAVTGEISVEPLVLVLVIFIWTPPHFWALAIDRVEEYQKSGVPMLPVTHGDTHTRWNIFCYTVLLVISTIIPYLLGTQGLLYLVSVLLLGGVFLHYAIAILRKRPGSEMQTFRYSILYLGLLFAAVLIDHHGTGMMAGS